MELADLAPLMHSAFTGDYQPCGLVDDADCVMAFAMGYKLRDDAPIPGAGNQDLAQYIFSNCGNLMVFAQEEVAVALFELGYEGTIISAGEMGQTTTSYRVLLQLVAKMMSQKLKRPLIVASAYQVSRVRAMMSRMNLSPIIPPGLPAALDPASALWRTRQEFNWTIWELCAWLHHWINGWI